MVKNISTVVFTIFNCFLHFHGGGNVKNNNLKADKMSIGILGAGDEYPHKPMGENDKEETTLLHLSYPPNTGAGRLIKCPFLFKNRTYATPAGPIYFALSSNPNIGINIKGRNRSPIVKPTPLPKLFDNSLSMIIPKIKFTIGISIKMNHHSGLPIISNKTMTL